MNGETSTTKTLSDEDFQRLNQLLSSSDFQLALRDGFQCPNPPTDVGETFQLSFADGGSWADDVTGCTNGQGASEDSIPRQVHEILVGPL